jgi:hypothetical protein
VRRDAGALLTYFVGTHRHRRATDRGAAAREGTDTERHFGRIAVDDVDVLHRQIQPIGRDLSEGRLMALSV